MANRPLISAAELRRALIGSHDQRPVLLDVRWRLGGPPGAEEYAAGHIPGASYVDLEVDLADPAGGGGRHPLPDPGRFASAMRRQGVRRRHPVVVYDDSSGLAAARAWWLLRYHDHADVRLLDGGWAAWRAAGGAVEQTTPEVPPGDFVGAPGAMPMVTASSVPAVGVLVDARAPERFRGEIEPIDPVAGHIPGAANVPTSANLTSEGTFRAAAELAEVYAAVGAVPDADVAAYCGSGVTAAHDVLAMELAGVRAALYPGSWSEWLRDPSRAVARGETS